MKDTNNHSQKPNANGISKSNYFLAQERTFFLYLKENIATATMVSDATGIPQKNITRYKRHYEKAGLLLEVEKKKCTSTGFKAWYLTTNQNLINKI